MKRLCIFLLHLGTRTWADALQERTCTGMDVLQGYFSYGQLSQYSTDRKKIKWSAAANSFWIGWSEKNNGREKLAKHYTPFSLSAFMFTYLQRFWKCWTNQGGCAAAEEDFTGEEEKKGGKAYFSRVLPLRGRRTKKNTILHWDQIQFTSVRLPIEMKGPYWSLVAGRHPRND